MYVKYISSAVCLHHKRSCPLHWRGSREAEPLPWPSTWEQRIAVAVQLILKQVLLCHHNWLPEEVVELQSLETFKTWLEMALNDLQYLTLLRPRLNSVIPCILSPSGTLWYISKRTYIHIYILEIFTYTCTLRARTHSWIAEAQWITIHWLMPVEFIHVQTSTCATRCKPLLLGFKSSLQRWTGRARLDYSSTVTVAQLASSNLCRLS